MRIGFFTDTYLPVSNGICYVIEILKKDLEAAGHEVYVFAPANIFKKQPEEGRVIRYKALQGLLYSDQFLSFFWAPRQLQRIEAMNLDVIMSFTPSLIGGLGGYAAIRLNLPFVIQYGTDMESYADEYKLTTFVGILGAIFIVPYFLRLGFNQTIHFYKQLLVKPPKQRYFRWACRVMMGVIHQKSSLVIATSEKTAQQLKGWHVQQQVVALPTGVDELKSNQLQIDKFRDEFGFGASDRIVLYVGRPSIEKNLEKLIEAFTKLAKKHLELKLLFVGDFQYRKRLEELAYASGYGEQIVFAGQVPREQMGSIYKLANVFAFPSLTDCQALVLNEAAHAGLPLVWCDISELNPVLKDGVTGLRAKNSATAIANQIEKIVYSPKLKLTYGKNAKKVAKELSERKQTLKLEVLLEGLS